VEEVVRYSKIVTFFRPTPRSSFDAHSENKPKTIGEALARERDAALPLIGDEDKSHSCERL